MSDTKWTPGPWIYQQWGSQILDIGKGSSQVLIATIATNTRKDEGRYNAHLVAAAPEMAEVLDMLVDAPELQGGAWEKMAREVLAKARGES